jgi:hypothetical protein
VALQMLPPAAEDLHAQEVDEVSSLGDAKSSLGDAESSLGDDLSLLGDTLELAE